MVKLKYMVKVIADICSKWSNFIKSDHNTFDFEHNYIFDHILKFDHVFELANFVSVGIYALLVAEIL